MLRYKSATVVPVAFACISFASSSICADVAVPPTINAGELFAVPDKSCVLLNTTVPVAVIFPNVAAPVTESVPDSESEASAADPAIDTS